MTTTTAVYSPATAGRWTTVVRRNAALFVVYGLLLVMFVAASLLSERFHDANTRKHATEGSDVLGRGIPQSVIPRVNVPPKHPGAEEHERHRD